ncbi:hypothetical protein HNP84_000967 [Thermocatellispora tengchongensis]|uniref:Regulatory protein n=1 Tax=Thermocatellispora tengchongensis TaxID=1073253 RepID=A0A840P034_9ACTN|nr:DUF5685 family protein [Thermocatellispora tengchongensis]MBB5131261.1 hypothetical protein [Thermocatellispora tengchongensis]
MFGIIRPCRHTLCGGLHRQWLSHLCGLCLTLRDRHGHAARTATNYDGLLVSVLTEAQAPQEYRRRKAGPCALRGFASAEVVPARAEGARLAAAASLILAAGKLGDHVADADGPYARPLVARAARALAGRWSRAGAADAGELGLDAAVITEALSRQPALEREAAGNPASPLLALTEPTETAVAAVFAHTGVLTGRPHNVPALTEAGRFFGRLAHLIDAVEDLPADRASGAFNPLDATGTDLAEARRLCEDAAHGLKLAIGDLDLARPGLTHALLVHEVSRAVHRTFAETTQDAPPGHHPGRTLPPRPSGLPGCLGDGLMACTCGAYQPRWSEDRGKRCRDRFDVCDCGDCPDCTVCCDAIKCCRSCRCDDGCCKCCDCDCNCN